MELLCNMFGSDRAVILGAVVNRVQRGVVVKMTGAYDMVKAWPIFKRFDHMS